MQRIDQHIQQHGAVFCAPDGLPIQDSDGTWEIRCYGPSGFIVFALTTHYGLEIVRKVEHLS